MNSNLNHTRLQMDAHRQQLMREAEQQRLAAELRQKPAAAVSTPPTPARPHRLKLRFA